MPPPPQCLSLLWLEETYVPTNWDCSAGYSVNIDYFVSLPFYLLIKYFLFPRSLSPSNDAEKCLLLFPVSEIRCPGISGTHFHTLDNDFLSFDMITLGLDCSWNLLNLNILFSGSVFAVKRFPLRQYV